MHSYQKIISEGLNNLGIISREQIQEALKAQEKSGNRLSQVLVELGIITNENIVDFLSSQFGIKPSKIAPEDISEQAAQIVNPKEAARHRIAPLKTQKNQLRLATDDLLNFLAVDNLKNILETELEIDFVFVDKKNLDLCLDKAYGRDLEKQAQQPAKPAVGQIKKKKPKPISEFLRTAETLTGKEEAPIVRLVTLLLEEAYQTRASDIHLEPLEDMFRIRYRIDGVLQQVPGPPQRLAGSLISRVKIMGGMNIAEKRLPQDGRIRFNVEDKELDLRVSSIPSIHGESIVMRILDKSSLVTDLKNLGFVGGDQQRYENLIKLPNGIILVTGPTGSGKTTTLYTSLAQINKPTKKILTLEDPVEYQIVGINQVQIKSEIGLTFASGLRAMLRQAPDVIMVGEIRDYETAAISIQASLTGHLIFSTLHTNSAPGAITRLVDMGVKPYLVASTLQGVLAQRLVRKICPSCKQEYQPSDEELAAFAKTRADIKQASFYKAVGCEECNSTGYRGRMAIYELLVLDDELRTLISEDPVDAKIREVAQAKDMHSLREDGWIKAAEGLTTLDEVLRVAQ